MRLDAFIILRGNTIEEINAMKRFSKTIALNLCILLSIGLALNELDAGTTGKIRGIVKDKESGDPLPGVNVIFEGTFIGAATNSKGEYFLLNVPAGRYTIRANMIGYAEVRKENVLIIPDFTVRLDFDLPPTSVMGEEIVIVAERPSIQKDQTMTMSVSVSEEIKNLPIRGFQAAANFTTGITINNARNLESGITNVNLRGGRPNETGVYIDGFQQNNLVNGLTNVNIPNGAVEEITTITGAYDAEYGRNQSGIIQVTTKSGSPQYSGNLEWVGDPGGLGIAEPYGYNVYSGSIGGPVIPGYSRLKFYLSGEARNIQDAEPSVFGYPEFRLSNEGVRGVSIVTGSDGNDSLIQDPTKMDTVIFVTDQNGNVQFKKGPRPKNSYGYGINSDRGYSFQTKISYEAIPGSLRLDLSGNYGETYRRSYIVRRILNRDMNLKREIYNLNIGSIITYTINPTSFADLGINYHSNNRDIFNDYLGRDLSQYVNLGLGNTGYTSYYDDGFFDDIGSYPYNDGYLRYYDAYTAIKLSYTNQADKHHQIRAGMDFYRHTVRFMDYVDFSNPVNGINDNVGFVIVNPDHPTIRHANKDDLENKILGAPHPISISGFIQDKVEYEGLVIRAGLRYDLFNPGVQRVRSWADPLGMNDPDQAGKFTDKNGNGVLDQNVDRIWVGTLGPEDYENARNSVTISPRLSVSFPISEKMQFRMSYGKFFQQPNLEELYIGPSLLESASLYGLGMVGNPNLKPEESVQYEVGLRRVMSEKIMVDVSLYYKDVSNLIAWNVLPSVPNSITLFDNVGNATIKGLSLAIEMKRTAKIQSRLAYTLQYAAGSASNEFSNYGGDQISSFNYPLSYDRRHTIYLDLDARNARNEGPLVGGIRLLENAGLNVQFSANSGLPYTPTDLNGRPNGARNSQSMPWTYRIDLKADRSIMVMKQMQVQAYIQIINLLDRKNVLSVYPSTGDAQENGFLSTPTGQFLNARQLLERQVNLHTGFRYDTPRQARLGILFSF